MKYNIPPQADAVGDDLGNVKSRPAAYNIADPQEVRRLYRECSGYLRTCRRDHHGTDLDGRMFAISALEELLVSTTHADLTKQRNELVAALKEWRLSAASRASGPALGALSEEDRAHRFLAVSQAHDRARELAIEYSSAEASGDHTETELSGRRKRWEAAELDFCKSIKLALTRTTEASGWRDIATAPRDGTRVLLWSEAWEMSWGTQIGLFDDGKWRCAEGSMSEDETEQWDDDEPYSIGPTHWQPPPSPPASPTNPRGDET